MLESQRDQDERRRVLANDALVLKQRKAEQDRTGTFLSHTHVDEAGGRFAAINKPSIVGTTELPPYPQASPPFQYDPVGDEPLLDAFENPAFEPTTPTAAVVATSDLPFSSDKQGVGRSPLSSRPFRRLK